MTLKVINQIKNLDNKRVLLRLDLNVPFSDGQVDKEDDKRVQTALPTIKYLLSKKAKVILFGALDECLQDGDTYIPLDYKTRGYPPREGDSELYYQTQLDTYATLLHYNGYQVGDSAYLVYYYPKVVKKNGVVDFYVKPVKVSVNVARLEKLLKESVEVLLGPVPKEHSLCEMNDWHQLISEFD